MNQTPVLCIVGPTATGKSALALHLAEKLNGEILNMDSMQIYRNMNIGTAKPTMAERCGIPHHLLDIVEPTQPFTVADYSLAAEQCIADVYGRGKLPMLVGGTGFYLRAITDGLHLGGIRSDPQLRESLKAIAAQPDGKQQLHQRLQQIDPEAAARLHVNDVQRVSRAIEVYQLTGKPISKQENVLPERPYRFCMLGTTLERTMLYDRANARVDTMMQAGLLQEVQALLVQGVPIQAQAMQGIGYKELIPVLRDGVPLESAVILLKQNTRHYAKRQWTWFRAESRIQWVDTSLPNSKQEALHIAETFWKEAQA